MVWPERLYQRVHRRRIEWLARYSLRSGDGIPAHIGSLTLWATQVGLNRDTLMRELQVRIVSAQDPGATDR